MLVQSSTSIQSIHMKTTYLRMKRILDVVFTLLISPFVLFVGLLVALWIKLDSEGPVFYRQKRIGQNGVEFEMFKFRSMYVNNDDMAHREKILMFMNGAALNNASEGGMQYKDVYDPRITRAGRFIRKLSLDELPQFWNVLRGEMSLVGPRPPLPYEVDEYSERDRMRLLGKPGLTGTWQVYGRSRVTFQNMVDMDIDYLLCQSLWYDLKLIFLTIPVMLLGRGGA